VPNLPSKWVKKAKKAKIKTVQTKGSLCPTTKTCPLQKEALNLKVAPAKAGPVAVVALADPEAAPPAPN
jgi:hypothetical protein